MPVGSQVVLSRSLCRSASLDRQSPPAPTSTTMERKRKKPLMEKKRRQRFNANLNELMTLVLDKDQAGATKVEKADVLEEAVRQLTRIENQRLVNACHRNPTVFQQFLAGFDDCQKAVENFVKKNDSNGGFNRDLGERLVQALDPVSYLRRAYSVASMSYATALQKRFALPKQPEHELTNEVENRKRKLEEDVLRIGTKRSSEESQPDFEHRIKRPFDEDTNVEAKESNQSSKIWRPYD